MKPQEKQELSAWLAENVMGWHQVRRFYYYPGILSYENMAIMAVDHWSPTDNIAQAFEVVEKMRPEYSYMIWDTDSYHHAMITSRYGKSNSIEHAETPALAICLAAKKAWEAK